MKITLKKKLLTLLFIAFGLGLLIVVGCTEDEAGSTSANIDDLFGSFADVVFK